jgi:hypothetical protein
MSAEKMSSMTPEEEFRIFGKISRASTEMLLDVYAAVGDGGVDDVQIHVQEALAQYPAEDFLSGILRQLNILVANVRGSNKEKLLGIIESLDDVAQTTHYATEYGRGELYVALNKIKPVLAK